MRTVAAEVAEEEEEDAVGVEEEDVVESVVALAAVIVIVIARIVVNAEVVVLAVVLAADEEVDLVVAGVAEGAVVAVEAAEEKMKALLQWSITKTSSPRSAPIKMSGLMKPQWFLQTTSPY